VRRVLLIALAALFLAGQAGDALGHGPVFVVVGGSGASGSVDAAIRRQIAAEKRALAGEQRRQQQLAVRLRSLRLELQDAVDPFQFEDSIAEVEHAIASAQAKAAARGGTLRRLRAALQPLALPSFQSSSPTVVGSDAVAIAEHYVGVRYLWGGSNPDSGFDCSGFVKYVYAQLGLTLPHYAASQFATTPRVDPSVLQPGDLVFFEPRVDGPGHVAIYVGGGDVIEAPHTGDVVKVASLAGLSSALGFVGATRPAQRLA